MSSRRLQHGLISSTAACLVVLTAGCTLAPRYERPTLPVSDEWAAPSNSTISQARAAQAEELAWEQLSYSPKLRELTRLALENNRDLRIAALNVQRVRELYRIQRAELVLGIDASGSLRRQRVPEDTVPGFGTFGGVTEQYSATLGASYELDVFGRLRSLNTAALQNYLAEQATQRSVRVSIIAEVARAYLGLANDLALRELAEATAKNQEDWFSLTEQRHRLGAVSTLELRQSQTQVESSRADVARYDGVVAQDVNALTLLVGTAFDRALLPTSADAGQISTSTLPVGIPSQVLLNRPDILAAEHDLRAANANIGAARAAFFPTISLTGTAGYASDELSSLFDSANRTWSFVPQILAPIFQGGRIAANARAARAGRDIALARYEQAIQIGFREVSDSLALADALRREREARERLVEASARAFELSEALRKVGRESYLVLLDAQRSYYTAQQSLISTRLAEQSNFVTLYQVLGGGEGFGSR